MTGFSQEPHRVVICVGTGRRKETPSSSERGVNSLDFLIVCQESYVQGIWSIVKFARTPISDGNLGTLCRLCLGVLGTIIVLSFGACGGVGVSNGAATASGSGNGEGVSVGNGSAALAWTPVTQNTDGTLLMDLAGYKVFYGQSTNAMSTVAVLSDPSLTSYVVTNLSSGVWYFTVAAYTSSGTQGVSSNVVTKTID